MVEEGAGQEGIRGSPVRIGQSDPALLTSGGEGDVFISAALCIPFTVVVGVQLEHVEGVEAVFPGQAGAGGISPGKDLKQGNAIYI